MSGGNGVDIAAVYQLLRQVADRVIAHDDKFTAIDRRFGSMQGSIDKQFAEIRSEIGGLRRTLTDYHASVMGHGILITEREQRVRRIEDHLHLPPAA